MPSDAVRPDSFHRNPEVLNCLIASAISYGALAKLLPAPIVPGDLGCALVGVALNLGWPEHYSVRAFSYLWGCETLH